MEQWRAVKGREGYYSVSDLGRVRSEDRVVVAPDPRGIVGTRRFLSKILSTRGGKYPLVTFTRPGTRQYCYVHDLVLEAFVGPKPRKLEVCHNDGNKRNCALSNLRYDTRKSNSEDTFWHGHLVRICGKFVSTR